jgi:hypothetical protein
MTIFGRHSFAVIIAVIAPQLAACFDFEFDLSGDPEYTIGDAGKVRFFYDEPFCFLSEACGLSFWETPIDIEEAFGYPLHVSVRSINPGEPLPAGLYLESMDESILRVEANGCGDISCSGNAGSCESSNSACVPADSIVQINVALHFVRPGVVGIELVDAAGNRYDWTTYTVAASPEADGGVE